jgi:hypothetical protein
MLRDSSHCWDVEQLIGLSCSSSVQRERRGQVPCMQGRPTMEFCSFFKSVYWLGSGGLTPVILDTQEAEIRRIKV